MAVNRRALLSAGCADVHISSLVVHCRPESVDSLVERIGAMSFAEVPEFSREGKLVVLLETPGEAAITDIVSDIEHLPGVVGAALVYHQIDSSETEDKP